MEPVVCECPFCPFNDYVGPDFGARVCIAVKGNDQEFSLVECVSEMKDVPPSLHEYVLHGVIHFLYQTSERCGYNLAHLTPAKARRLKSKFENMWWLPTNKERTNHFGAHYYHISAPGKNTKNRETRFMVDMWYSQDKPNKIDAAAAPEVGSEQKENV